VKILGAGNNTFVVEVGQNELANMCGFQYVSQSGCPKFIPGQEIHVGGIYKLAYEIMRARGQLKDMSDSLISTADILRCKQFDLENLIDGRILE